MYTQEDYYWIWLCEQPGIGPAKRDALLKACGSVVSVYEAGIEQYVAAGVKEEQARQLERSKDLEGVRKRCQEWANQGIFVITRAHTLFPEGLRNIYPSVGRLFGRGDQELLSTSCLSIVGSRKCSSYGAGVARYLGKHLAKAGYTIVSGMASGIDACAHQGALDARGKTIAILGCGIDICYPKGNLRLYEKIAHWGLILSEYPPGTPPKAGLFPMRNRIIAALSRAIVIVEAAERSGALITADQALDAGKEVFAVPGQIFSANSKGTHRLLRQGAMLISDWQDVPLELGDLVQEEQEEKKTFQDADVQAIWEQISWEAQSIQQLSQKLGIEADKFMQCITMLEMTGYVERRPDGSILRKKQ